MHRLLKLAIPMQRLALYLVLIGCLPIIGLSLLFLKQRANWKIVDQELTTVAYLSNLKAQKQSINHLVRKKYSDPDPLYIEHRFKGLSLLKKELASLEKLTHSPNYTGSDSVEKRLVFLKENNRQVTFIEKEIHTGEGIRETIESMPHPIEVDTDDLVAILEILEGDLPLKPQLIVRDFQLTRKVKPSSTEVFDLHIGLIKREFE